MRTVVSVVAGLATIVALAGASPRIETGPADTSFQRIAPDDRRVVPYEQHPASRIVDKDTRKLRATREVPGFGGAYLDAGTDTLHVWLTRPTAQLGRDAQAALARFVGPAGSRVNHLVRHRADYTFAQLKAWKDAAMELFALPEVALLGISERTNRLRIGVHGSDRLSPALAGRLADLGIPAAAVRVGSVDQPFTQQLSDDHRPLTGATQIQFSFGFLGTQTGNCSLGYPAVRGGALGFVTAAHCSPNQGAVDGLQSGYWQATRPFNDVGLEVFDPPFFFGGPCPPDLVCGLTDANFVQTFTGVTVNAGRIASVPCCGNPNWNGTDTRRVSDSFFTFVGNIVRKTGRTTGTRDGIVDEECEMVGVEQTNIALLCQDVIRMVSQPGDSGAPVFEVTNSPATGDVRAVGLHWGGGVIDGVTVAVLTPAPFLSDVIGASICSPTFGC